MCQLGVSQDSLLSESGIHDALISDPEGHVSVNQLLALFRSAERQSPVPCIGARYGALLDLSAHGLLAYSMLSQQRAGDLTRRAIQFLRIRVPLMEIELVPVGDGSVIRLHQRWPLEDMENFLVDCYLASMCRLSATMSKNASIQLQSDDPLRLQNLEEILGVNVEGGHNSDQLLISQCQGNQKTRLELGGVSDAEWNADQVTALVRHYIHCNPGRYCTLEHAAEKLGLTPRTLTRYLSTAGESFSQLRNAAREKFARHYLHETEFSIADIAEKLGYSDQASFTKAFRGWTGHSPGRLRKEQGLQVWQTGGSTRIA
ncbi:MAG: AraC family transcriptional regulator ligand-binding domain-containing protein [Alcanivoracaceae bacterium]|nr:AraC family transcriptional regulator ligand-binding domain-containing protein [Alcanivoracaceae bacterium]